MRNFSGNETYFEVNFLKPLSCQNVNGYSYKWQPHHFPWTPRRPMAIVRCRVRGPGGLTDLTPASGQAGGPSGRELHYRLLWNQTYKTMTDKHIEKVLSINIFKRSRFEALDLSREP